MGKTVMLFGLGDLGGWVLEFLARYNAIMYLCHNSGNCYE